MKEIGGYFELEEYEGNELHEKALALNCGRNCLSYLIKSKNIKKIYLPAFLCDSVRNVCYKVGCETESYSITKRFEPIFEQKIGVQEYLYIVNYYGQFSNEKILLLKEKYRNIIVDNAQAFFQMPVSTVDTLYTCRKYFGVADGAYLYTNGKRFESLEKDISYKHMEFLLGRYEKNAGEFYAQSVKNNKRFMEEDIKEMSRLTHNLLRGVNYEQICKKRTENFMYLHEKLEKINGLNVSIPDGAFMYPFYIENGAELRKYLQSQKVFVPLLWPNVLEENELDSVEWSFANNIVPIPVDQRYGVEEMEYICELIVKYYDRSRCE